AVYLFIDRFMFTAFLSVIIENMKIPFLFIRWIKLSFYGNSAYFIIPYAVSPVFFKGPFYFKDKTFYKFFHPLHHNDKLISAFVHVVEVLLAEIRSEDRRVGT